MFVKMQVKMREKTKVDVSMSAFNNGMNATALGGISLFKS